MSSIRSEIVPHEFVPYPASAGDKSGTTTSTEQALTVTPVRHDYDPNFFQVGGPLAFGAPSYIVRPADDKLLSNLRKGELCLIFAPRQSGKSSLRVRTSHILQTEDNATVVNIDLQSFGSAGNDAASWFKTIIQIIEHRLTSQGIPLPTTAQAWWQARQELVPSYLLEAFLEQVVLPEVPGNLYILIDEIDAALKLPFAQDFFTTLRALYNARVERPDLRRLTFALFGTATRSLLVMDKARTPFNVGVEIPVNDFTWKDLEAYCRVLGNDDTARALTERIYYWAAGQPFLTQQMAHVVYQWPEEERSVACLDKWVEENYLKRRIEDDTHLKGISDKIINIGEDILGTLNLYIAVIGGNIIHFEPDSKEQDVLLKAGLLRLSEGYLAPRNEIYRTIFNTFWVEHCIFSYIQENIVIQQDHLSVMAKQVDAMRRARLP